MTQAADGLAPHVVFGKLEYARWRSWPSVERDAVRAFLGLVWALALARTPTELPAGEWLKDIARAESDLGPYLGRWEADPSRRASLHIAELALQHAEALRRPGVVLPGAWPTGPWHQVEAWLLSPGTSERLERAFFEAGDDGAAEECLGAACDALERARRERRD